MGVCLGFGCTQTQEMMPGSVVSWIEALLAAIRLGCAPHTAETTVGYLSLAMLAEVPVDSELRMPGLYTKAYLSVKCYDSTQSLLL